MISRLLHPELKILATIVLLLAGIRPVMGAGFAASVSPPRFELSGNPGDVLRDHLDIRNHGDQPGTFLLRTADWDMTEDGSATFHPPALQPGSCRPWVRIERHKIRVPAQAVKRYRFQIDIPEDAPVSECRLALMIEAPKEDAVVTQADSLSIPVHARVAVVIYVAVGGAAPDLVFEDMLLEEINGRLTPVAVMHNRGSAHGRPTGFFVVTTADGERLDFEVVSLPVLPGQTRRIPLQESVLEGAAPHTLNAPVGIKGTFEWRGGKLGVDQRVE